jgi:YD repeat-containing protein
VRGVRGPRCKLSVVSANVATLSGYGRHDLLTGLTDANGHTRGRGYSAAGRQVSETDGLSRTTSYGYDGLGRHTRVSAPGYNTA